MSAWKSQHGEGVGYGGGAKGCAEDMRMCYLLSSKARLGVMTINDMRMNGRNDCTCLFNRLCIDAF